jgi:processive 1,2-diacylglycerol beta-glucosyltransferase
MKTKVLILHTSVGYGIKATADNIAEQLNQSGMFEVRNEDVEKVESGLASSAVKNVYLTLLDHISGLWGFLYNSRVVMFLSLPLRKFIFSFKSKNVLKILREFQPAIVISTQTVPSGIMAYLKAKNLYLGKLVIVFSDYHLHRFWLYNEADLYICNIPEQVTELKKFGVAENKIKLTGTLIAEKFNRQITKEEALDQLGLLKSMPVVLMGGAGRARASNKLIFLQLLRSPRSFQVVVICGKNEQLKSELMAITPPAPHPVKILGYVDNMEVLMSAADVLIYKTGGPSMAEAVVKKLPMILTDIRPGHELINLNYLVSHGIARYARIPREAVFMAESVLDGKIKFDHEKNFRQIVRPAGSISIAEAIKALAPQDTLKVSNYQETADPESGSPLSRG